MHNFNFSTSLLFLLLSACGEVDGITQETETVLCKMSFDDDCDGYLNDVDCDDNDPNSTTLSNDPDCDGIVIGEDCDDNDEFAFVGSAELDASEECMRDSDGDGFGDVDVGEGVVTGSDCDDDKDSIYPNAEEICDGLKNDCLSEEISDEELDVDGDGFVVVIN